MNWGNKLLATFFSVWGGHDLPGIPFRKTNYELVDKDYYKNELAYQQVIDGTTRANALSAVTIQQNKEGITLQLPAEMKNKQITGTVHFTVPMMRKKDKTATLNPSAEGAQVFSNTVVLPGEYTVKISWTSDGISYYAEKNLLVHE